MKKAFVPALAVAIVAGLGGYGLANYAGARSAPPMQVTDNAPPPAAMHGWGLREWATGGKDNCHMAFRQRGIFRGMFFPVADKHLSTADVQTIAQAILLRHGNHAWEIANVAQSQDDTISFAFATQSGEVIAQFAMDTRTGHLHRLG